MITDDRYVYEHTSIQKYDDRAISLNTSHNVGFGKVNETTFLLADQLEFSYKVVKTAANVTKTERCLVEVTITGVEIDRTTYTVKTAKYKRKLLTFSFQAYIPVFKLNDLAKVI